MNRKTKNMLNLTIIVTSLIGIIISLSRKLEIYILVIAFINYISICHLFISCIIKTVEKDDKAMYVRLNFNWDNVILRLGTFDKLGGAKLLEEKGGKNMNKKDFLILSLVIIIFLLLFLLFIVLI